MIKLRFYIMQKINWPLLVMPQWRGCNKHVKYLLCISFIENVALRGVATQSARYGNDFGAAYNAIDGNRESDNRAGSCSHTTEMRNPWWRVDLLESYIITSITIVNRDDCCPERINGLEVHIGNSVERDGFENPVWVNMKVTFFRMFSKLLNPVTPHKILGSPCTTFMINIKVQ